MNNLFTDERRVNLLSNILIEKEVPGNSDSVEVVMSIPGVDVTVPMPSPNQPGVWFKSAALLKMNGGMFTAIVREKGMRWHESQWRFRQGAEFVVVVRHPITQVLVASFKITNAEPTL